MFYFIKKYDIIYYKYSNTTLQLFSQKNIVQGFLMYNEFDQNITKEVTLYDKIIIHRKNFNW